MFAQAIDNNPKSRELSFNKLKTSMGMKKLIQPQLGETQTTNKLLQVEDNQGQYYKKRSTTPNLRSNQDVFDFN